MHLKTLPLTLIAAFAIALPSAASPQGTKKGAVSAPKSSGASPDAQSAGSKKEEQSTASNAGLCRDLEERALGWDRAIVEFAKSKAQSETKLANCRIEEKENRTLPHQCDQYEQQIEGFVTEIKKAEEGKKQIRDEVERYKCK